MSRPVLAHVIHSLGTGGLENGVVNLVNGSGPDFRHVVVCAASDGAFRTRLRSDVEVVVVGREGGNARQIVRLTRVLRRLAPAISHSRNWPTIDAVIAAKLAGVRRVVHGEHGREFADPNGRNRRRNRVRRLLAPAIDRFVTVSHDLRRWLVDEVGIAAAKVVRIVNGVDTDRFAPRDRDAIRARLGIAADALVIGTVGRLDPVKDHHGLLRACRRLASAHPDLAVVIAGDGPCRGDLARLVATLGLEGRVHLVGERRDVPDVLAALDVFVLPSIAEGISNTILEAMATGLPIVATAVGGNPELVDDGAHGALVPAGDVDRLASAIGGYLADGHLATVHGKASRERALVEFGLDRMVAEYTRLYTTLAGGRA